MISTMMVMRTVSPLVGQAILRPSVCTWRTNSAGEVPGAFV
jgi:hypothetical protein